MTERRRLDAAPPPQQEEPLHLKYRPRRLADVVGQEAVTRAVRAALDMSGRPHCWLFTGPPGTGKTTLGRIVAAECGVEPGNVVEVDAASRNGVDDVRALTEGLAYGAFGESPGKAILLNECQRLSGNAWDALLTVTEEPPPHAYFVLTSTNPAKIPAAMQTRCQVFPLRALRRDDVLDVLERVCDEERFDTAGRVLDMVADAAGGSMRAALTMLSSVHALRDERDVADVLERPLEDAEVIDLCRLMVSGRLTWARACDVLARMSDPNAEGVRLVVCAYLSKVAAGARSDRDAEDALDVLREFVVPFDPAARLAPLLVALGRVVFR
jgi:DNA polymerase III gamma/tau subunit